ncbi:CheR family methyltransferase [Phytopseudomonas punonensis]|uniref:Chemotaxis protein methyltransferase WspC n=1 Tax=Phytopseudomonas punonensis TaxID=1220495 RepID=A0A1M7KC35_9GAMM|nr:protein-glutamate O-methyltransferase CheR [Pseudomonas punonensis]SHM62794.1 chemotaxis protein methyltransferase WspC [Pseudomonas punonensis]
MSARFEQLLHGLIGLDAESVGQVVIDRAVRQRVVALGCADEDAYWLKVQASASEQQALVEAVVVPETWFFRYPESFIALANLARERSKQLAGARPLRILSLPCSTGEEPYSIAMALLDAGLPGDGFRIDAMDISEVNLQRAGRAIYGRNSFRGDDLSFRDRHFSETPEGFELRGEVRRKVRLLAGNLLAPGLLAGEAPYDFVFCRNLLIYFDRPTQHAVAAVLQRLMREDGALFIGPAEASLFSQVGMQALNIPLAFVFRRQAPRPASAPSPMVPSITTRPRPAAAAAPVPVRRAPAPVAAPAVTADTSLDEIAVLANAGRSDEARAACERYLAAHGPTAQAFYWLGLLSDVAGRSGDAQDYYRKTLYLAPTHAEALAHLSALLAARGDMAGARRLQQRAGRGVSRDER